VKMRIAKVSCPSEMVEIVFTNMDDVTSKIEFEGRVLQNCVSKNFSPRERYMSDAQFLRDNDLDLTTAIFVDAPNS